MVIITSEKNCSLCNRKIVLDEHPAGLVFADKHFLCEDCSTKHSKDDLIMWTKSIMHSPQTGMPIALWLIHEQNKDKTIMTSMKKLDG